jgi:hypothetical protein
MRIFARAGLGMGLMLASLGALAAPAAAGGKPDCWNPEIFGRPGLERSYAMFCQRTDAVELARAPAHGRLTGLAWDGLDATFRYTPDDDAPRMDGFALTVTGPNGTVTQEVSVFNVPLEENSAPICEPVQQALRTDGSAPAVLEMHIYCWDWDHDSMVLEGDGPGEHLDAPKRIVGGHNSIEVPWWRYRTATRDGDEAATFWATDDLGARSPETAMSFKVGPGVDRPTECGGGYPGAYPIFTRPGATRRFGLHCRDADFDPFVTTVGTPPRHGTLATFDLDPPRVFLDGIVRWVDAVYVPDDDAGLRDPFTVVSTSPGRAPAESAFEMVPEVGTTHGGGCGWSSGVTYAGVPTVLELHCSDGEGDPLEATIVREPDHGEATPPALTPGRYGSNDIRIAYVPDPGWTGLDCVKVRITDGAGYDTVVLVDIYVREPPLPDVPLPDLPLPDVPLPDVPLPEQPLLDVPLPEQPRPDVPSPDPAPSVSPSPPAPPTQGPSGIPVTAPLPAGGEPSVGQSPALAPADQARSALRAPDVVLLRRAGGARIYADRRSRRRGVRAGRPALAITCDLPCRLTARLRSRRAGALGSGTRRLAAAPGRAAVLRAPRAAAAGGWFAIDVTVRSQTGTADRATVRLRLRR